MNSELDQYEIMCKKMYDALTDNGHLIILLIMYGIIWKIIIVMK